MSNPAYILLVDDNAGVLQRTRDFLQHRGYDVTATDNVFRVASMVASRQPDLVVVDIMMPALRGDNLAYSLERFYKLPIVFYSAVEDEYGKALVQRVPNAKFVSKATGLRLLADVIDETLKQVQPADT